MLWKKYLEDKVNLRANNMLLKFCLICMCIAVCISGLAAYKATVSQKIVILPPVVDERIEITNNDANDGYLRLFTRYVCSLFATYNPGTVAGQFEDLLALTAPEYYAELSADLEKLKAEVIRLRISSVFYPREIEIKRKKGEITVSGLGKQSATSTVIKEGQTKYIIKYRIINGKFYVTEVGNAEK